MSSERLLNIVDRQFNTLFYNESKYKNFLDIVGKFHGYSIENMLLILSQCPSASKIAGYHTWKNKYGRKVKADAKGIELLAPKTVSVYVDKTTNRVVKYKDVTKDELQQALRAGLVERKRQQKGYINITVFDISETDGNEIDIEGINSNVIVNDIDKLCRVVERVTGIKMTLVNVGDEFKKSGNEIVIINHGDISTIKELISKAIDSFTSKLEFKDEIYSGEYNDTEVFSVSDIDRLVINTSITYIILNKFGIETDDYNFKIITNWANSYISTKEGKRKLKLLVGYIGKIADRLLIEIENEYGISINMIEENNVDTIREHLAEELLTMLEANAARVKINGGGAL